MNHIQSVIEATNAQVREGEDVQVALTIVQDRNKIWWASITKIRPYSPEEVLYDEETSSWLQSSGSSPEIAIKNLEELLGNLK